MPVPVDHIIERASQLLSDVANVRWTVDELLQWVNDGQREAVNLVPAAYPLTTTVDLVEGTRQALPSAAVKLIEITRNMAGSTPGRAVRIVDRNIMDTENPDWHSATADATVINYVYNPEAPLQYYVYPPQPVAPGSVEMTYGAVPADLLRSDDLTINEGYQHSILDYVLYRAYSKDTEGSGLERATAHYKAFSVVLTGHIANSSVEPT